MTSRSRSATLLGFDYGRRRIGVAVGQQITRSATPLMTIAARDGKPDWDSVTRAISEWNPAALVVGVPYHMDGTEQEMTKAALKFCRQLEARYGLPVYQAEERLSSYVVETGSTTARDRQAGVDPMAAQVILQDWLQKDHSE